MTSIRQAARRLAMIAALFFLVVDGWEGGGGTDRHRQLIALAEGTSIGDLTARWEGTWVSSRFAAEGTLMTLLAQSVSLLSGQVTIAGTACVSVGAVSGTVSGDAVVFGAVFAGDVEVHFEGTVREGGMTMEGTYEVSGGTCAGDTGTWRLAKIAIPCDANGDGMISGRDAFTLFRFLRRGGDPLPGYPDCNKDGLLNFRDVIAILAAITR